jgi:hypothetical protein
LSIRLPLQKYFYMKSIVLILSLLIITCSTVNAQTKLPPIDKSPMDMSYYPNTYPLLKMQDKATEPLMARVIYGRPQKNGRVVFGELLEYGKVWRLGANEATEIEFFQNAKVGNAKIKKGRYTMYCVPYSDKWTVIFNKDTDAWGSFKYDVKKDVARVEVPVTTNTENAEAFTMVFEKSTAGANLIMAWDNIKVSVPISFL